ncbi:hypothetical protein J6590_056132 [Homalodisca vitripennis]|nr:hypothetical protein J6590_056132 [Homalodisca vitripennis]
MAGATLRDLLPELVPARRQLTFVRTVQDDIVNVEGWEGTKHLWKWELAHPPHNVMPNVNNED